MPEDIHYVFAGLAPLSVRFIEMLISAGGFKGIQSQLKYPPGAQVEPENEQEFFRET